MFSQALIMGPIWGWLAVEACSNGESMVYEQLYKSEAAAPLLVGVVVGAVVSGLFSFWPFDTSLSDLS